mmetsp:Transcript_8059/g.15085  ORF Transcript_8059/g.15085 Transcript_8059/m.15085 type:complete len:280 (-) Transcript_8059:82-921(-)
MADLAALQNELKAAKEKWADVKLGKAKKEAETFPFPVWLMQAVQQPPVAAAYDVMEIPVKLIVSGLDPEQTSVEVPSAEIPPQLQAKIAEAVLETWRKNIGKKSAPWGIMKTLDWVEANFVKLLNLDPACVGAYEGCDENGASMRRYAIGPPAAPVEEREEEESDEEESEEDDEATQAFAAKVAALLASADEVDSSGRKKLTPEEIERKKAEAAEMGEKSKQMSKAERAEQNKTRKEKAGQRMAKTGQAHRKFDGEGATSKEEKKKKNSANVAKRFGLS